MEVDREVLGDLVLLKRFFVFLVLLLLSAARQAVKPCRSWVLTLSKHLRRDCLLGPTWPVSFRLLTQVK
jgi:hypothetical protein